MTITSRDLLPIGELAARSGHAPSALRYYEELGLIDAERTAGGQRRYRRATLRRLAFIRAAQTIGLSLDEVSEALAQLPHDHVPTTAEWNRIATAWQQRIDDQIAELRKLRSRLTECVGCGCLSVSRCGLSNPGDTAARRGPGARFLLGDDPAAR
ncbi:redox-sensitive transcriptional activator SoxR [Actinacidiphila rubida]|uniref:MerR family transcriptional regulator, redox-sensitive transcriptional activator SoxR n=1 Tax=Actinacidiphila rubida TaxID=310780 RepID=A0A1H8T1B3_9ACTN|nr:redox-sensitive transcriptional activator SoxR [Actinacidiphila rubida]SEO84702.1 MerR family transcriptional regulator, redox-sensitive transcriptional activator SoxR [Actinacidiphila rubida]